MNEEELEDWKRTFTDMQENIDNLYKGEENDGQNLHDCSSDSNDG